MISADQEPTAKPTLPCDCAARPANRRGADTAGAAPSLLLLLVCAPFAPPRKDPWEVERAEEGERM